MFSRVPRRIDIFSLRLTGGSSDPEAARYGATTEVLTVRAECAFYFLWMGNAHVVAGPQNLKFFVKRKKGVEDILFVQAKRLMPIEHTQIIFSRQIDIMNVDDDTRLEPWQDLQELIIHITIDLGNMTGVNKQNVIGFQCGETL